MSAFKTTLHDNTLNLLCRPETSNPSSPPCCSTLSSVEGPRELAALEVGVPPAPREAGRRRVLQQGHLLLCNYSFVPRLAQTESAPSANQPIAWLGGKRGLGPSALQITFFEASSKLLSIFLAYCTGARGREKSNSGLLSAEMATVSLLADLWATLPDAFNTRPACRRHLCSRQPLTCHLLFSCNAVAQLHG